MRATGVVVAAAVLLCAGCEASEGASGPCGIEPCGPRATFRTALSEAWLSRRPDRAGESAAAPSPPRARIFYASSAAPQSSTPPSGLARLHAGEPVGTRGTLEQAGGSPGGGEQPPGAETEPDTDSEPEPDTDSEPDSGPDPGSDPVPPGPFGLDALADVAGLARIRPEIRSGHASSFDRSGGNRDWGFALDEVEGEPVVLALDGPGCVYRVWFTGQSDKDYIRVYFDGEARARIDMPTSAFFLGEDEPFVVPLTVSEPISSGGYVSYVPLCFARSIRITTDSSAYYNLDYQLFEPGTAVQSFSASESSERVREQWARAGSDPEPDAGSAVERGELDLAAGQSGDLVDLRGEGAISAVRIRIDGVGPGKPPGHVICDDGRSFSGTARFRVAVDAGNHGVVLRRRLDHGVPDQLAAVRVDGAFVGEWGTPGRVESNRWLDASFTIPEAFTAGKESIAVELENGSSADWTEFRYWVHSLDDVGGSALTDELDVADDGSETDHGYQLTSASWRGTQGFTYPSATRESGSAFAGSSQFRLALDPRNQGGQLFRLIACDPAEQRASVYVDEAYAGDWITPGVSAVECWREVGFELPASLTRGKAEVTVRVQNASDAHDFTAFRYWAYAQVDGRMVQSDELDIGGSASEQAHEHSVLGSTTWLFGDYSHALDDSAAVLASVRMQIFWDDELRPSVDAPLGELFGLGHFGAANVRGLLFGMDASGEMYLYFPMPFGVRARLRLTNGSSEPVAGVHFEVRHRSQPWSDQLGYFKTQYHAQPPGYGRDILLLETEGAGHVVGVVQSLTGSPMRFYLEGDERALIDDRRTPAIQGTGTEDFYNGGWYFSYGTFGLPLHGNPVHRTTDDSDSTAMYRTFLSDAIRFRRHIRLSIEHGPNDEVPVDAHSLVWYYASRSALVPSDTLDVGDEASVAAHDYQATDVIWTDRSTFAFEGELPQWLTASGLGHVGPSGFTVALPEANRGATLRVLLDQGRGSQRADVYVDGERVGRWSIAGSNPFYRWREEDFDIPARFTAGKTRIAVRIEPDSSAVWNEYQYRLYALTR